MLYLGYTSMSIAEYWNIDLIIYIYNKNDVFMKIGFEDYIKSKCRLYLTFFGLKNKEALI